MTTQTNTRAAHQHTAAQAKSGGARLTAALLLLLGFGFTASALVESPAPVQPDRSHLVARASIGAPPEIADPASVRSPEVDAAIANWTAETPSEQRPTQGSYDWEELWLPR
jgi:hypothetical protein